MDRRDFLGIRRFEKNDSGVLVPENTLEQQGSTEISNGMGLTRRQLITWASILGAERLLTGCGGIQVNKDGNFSIIGPEKLLQIPNIYLKLSSNGPIENPKENSFFSRQQGEYWEATAGAPGNEVAVRLSVRDGKILDIKPKNESIQQTITALSDVLTAEKQLDQQNPSLLARLHYLIGHYNTQTDSTSTANFDIARQHLSKAYDLSAALLEQHPKTANKRRDGRYFDIRTEEDYHAFRYFFASTAGDSANRLGHVVDKLRLDSIRKKSQHLAQFKNHPKALAEQKKFLSSKEEYMVDQGLTAFENAVTHYETVQHALDNQRNFHSIFGFEIKTPEILANFLPQLKSQVDIRKRLAEMCLRAGNLANLQFRKEKDWRYYNPPKGLQAISATEDHNTPLNLANYSPIEQQRMAESWKWYNRSVEYNPNAIENFVPRRRLADTLVYHAADRENWLYATDFFASIANILNLDITMPAGESKERWKKHIYHTVSSMREEFNHWKNISIENRDMGPNTTALACKDIHGQLLIKSETDIPELGCKAHTITAPKRNIDTSFRRLTATDQVERIVAESVGLQNAVLRYKDFDSIPGNAMIHDQFQQRSARVLDLLSF